MRTRAEVFASLGSPDDAAAAWIARRDHGFSAEEAARFDAWLRADRRHAEAFERAEAAWSALPGLRAMPAAALAALAAPRPIRSRLTRVLWVSAAAASVVFAARVFFATHTATPDRGAPTPKAHHYQSPADAEAHFILPDGSTAELHRGSALTFTQSPTERQIVLWHGEAHFTVAKQVPQPFIVRAGLVVVRDLGTAFDVRRDADRVAVLVTQGCVEVSRASGDRAAALVISVAQLNAGEQAVVSTAAVTGPAEVSTPSAAETERVLAWKTRRLVFNRTPLADAVAEFNRRQSRRLVIADADTGAVLLSGTVQSDSVDAFVRLLSAGFGVAAEERGDNQIILRKTH